MFSGVLAWVEDYKLYFFLLLFPSCHGLTRDVYFYFSFLFVFFVSFFFCDIV